MSWIWMLIFSSQIIVLIKQAYIDHKPVIIKIHEESGIPNLKWHMKIMGMAGHLGFCIHLPSEAEEFSGFFFVSPIFSSHIFLHNYREISNCFIGLTAEQKISCILFCLFTSPRINLTLYPRIYNLFWFSLT